MKGRGIQKIVLATLILTALVLAFICGAISREIGFLDKTKSQEEILDLLRSQFTEDQCKSYCDSINGTIIRREMEIESNYEIVAAIDSVFTKAKQNANDLSELFEQNSIASKIYGSQIIINCYEESGMEFNNLEIAKTAFESASSNMNSLSEEFENLNDLIVKLMSKKGGEQ